MLQVDRGRWGRGVGGGWGRIRHTITALPSSLLFPECSRDASVCRVVEGQLLGVVSLDLNSLGVSDVEVLWSSLLGRRAVLGVGAAALLRGGVVQHDGRAVASRVVRS